MSKDKKRSNKRQAKQHELKHETIDRFYNEKTKDPNHELNLPESVRVVHGEELNGNDG